MKVTFIESTEMLKLALTLDSIFALATAITLLALLRI
jgi:hypothetical protein